MAIEISNQGDYISVRMFGVIVPDDLERLSDEGEAIEQSLPADLNRISDITSVESFDIRFGAVLNLAKRREARKLRNSIKSAIVAVKPAEIGFARMFQTLTNNPRIEVRIVQSREEALAWFAEGGPKP